MMGLTLELGRFYFYFTLRAGAEPKPPHTDVTSADVTSAPAQVSRHQGSFEQSPSEHEGGHPVELRQSSFGFRYYP